MQKQESKINILQIKQKKVIMSIKTAQIKYQKSKDDDFKGEEETGENKIKEKNTNIKFKKKEIKLMKKKRKIKKIMI